MTEKELEVQVHLMKQPFWAMLWGRAKILVAKIVGIKTVIFIVATVLKFAGVLGDWAWVVIATAVISIRLAEKVISKQ